MARYHGKKQVVYISTSAAGTAVSLPGLTRWSLDRSTDKEEVSAGGDANKAYVQGLPDLKGTISAWFEDTNDMLFDASDSADGVKLYLYPSSDAPTIYHYGPAWLDASIDVPSKGAISLTGNFVANGAWGRKP